MPVKLDCVECGETYEKPPSKADSSKFCSKECYSQYRSQQSKWPELTDENWLRKKHHEEKLSTGKIADILGCSIDNVQDWMKKHGINVIHPHERDQPWKNREKLKQLYISDDMTQEQIASHFGVSQFCIYKWLSRNDLVKTNIGPFRTSTRGYERFYSNGVTIGIHRLVAIAEYGFDQVDGKDVHHKNSIPWDNRSENLKPVTRKEHAEIHNESN